MFLTPRSKYERAGPAVYVHEYGALTPSCPFSITSAPVGSAGTGVHERHPVGDQLLRRGRPRRGEPQPKESSHLYIRKVLLPRSL